MSSNKLEYFPICKNRKCALYTDIHRILGFYRLLVNTFQHRHLKEHTQMISLNTSSLILVLARIESNLFLVSQEKGKWF